VSVSRKAAASDLDRPPAIAGMPLTPDQLRCCACALARSSLATGRDGGTTPMGYSMAPRDTGPPYVARIAIERCLLELSRHAAPSEPVRCAARPTRQWQYIEAMWLPCATAGQPSDSHPRHRTGARPAGEQRRSRGAQDSRPGRALTTPRPRPTVKW